MAVIVDRVYTEMRDKVKPFQAEKKEVKRVLIICVGAAVLFYKSCF
jgi:hypothetical protein